MIISFSWTWPALVAGAKTVTRRSWNAGYAAKFEAGQIIDAWDRSPRAHGQKIGCIRLTENPFLQRLAGMPESDYEAEGFAWLCEHPETIPKGTRKQLWGQCTLESFYAWKGSGQSLYVVRFELLDVTDEAKARLDAMLAKGKPAAVADLPLFQSLMKGQA